MFWEKSGELFRCLPLIEVSGEEQLQLMYDCASIHEDEVNIPMLTASYAFLRSTSSVDSIAKNGKVLGGADIEKLLNDYSQKFKVASCDKLIRSYCDNEVVYEICDCCPCSSTYKNKYRKEEFELLAYVLSNGGPMYVDLLDLGIDDLASLVKSQEPIPFGKVANKFVPYPLFQKLAEFMVESPMSCFSADAFWEGFSGIVYSRKAKQYKYGKIDETALSYIKNLVYSLFDEKYKELNFDNLRLLFGSTSVGDGNLVSESKPIATNVSEPTKEVEKETVTEVFEEISVMEQPKEDGNLREVVISESDDMVVIGDFFDDMSADETNNEVSGLDECIAVSETKEVSESTDGAIDEEKEPNIVDCDKADVELAEVSEEVVTDNADFETIMDIAEPSSDVVFVEEPVIEEVAVIDEQPTDNLIEMSTHESVEAPTDEEVVIDDDEPFLSLLGVKEEKPDIIVGSLSALDAWEAATNKASVTPRRKLDFDLLQTSIVKKSPDLNYDNADDEVLCNGFLLKKKNSVSSDILPF